MRNRTYLYLSKDKALPSPAGCYLVDQHTVRRDGNNLYLEKTGVLDTQELIQSYEDGVSLEKMIQRFRRGDETAFQRKQAFFADTSGMSIDMREVIENGRAAQRVVAEAQSKSDSATAAVDQNNDVKKDGDLNESQE